MLRQFSLLSEIHDSLTEFKVFNSSLQHTLLTQQVSSVLGFTWILMFIAGLVDTEFLWWIAATVNSLQGVHIFFAFGMNERVRQIWRKQK